MINLKSQKTILSALLLLVLSSVFSISSYSQETITTTITHDGIERSYILYVPANYTGKKPVPLLLNFHGYTSNATEQMFYGDFRPIAEEEGFLIVHPNGTLDFSGNTHFNVGWGGSTVDDIGFTSALLDTIIAEYKIDKKRIYSTGMSNGGFMSYALACAMSDRIAAVASVTGSMNVGQNDLCSPERNVPVLEIHGTNDLTVPYEGGGIFQATEDVVDFWVNTNNLKPTPKVIAIEDTNTTDGSTVEHYIYKGGRNNVNVELFKITGGGHTWPGSAFDLGIGTNYDINASEEIWKFFSQYDINGRIKKNYGCGNGNYNVNIYPNPTSSYVYVTGDFSKKSEYKIVTTRGTVIKKGTLNGKKTKINLSDLPSKIYFLQIDNKYYKIFKTK